MLRVGEDDPGILITKEGKQQLSPLLVVRGYCHVLAQAHVMQGGVPVGRQGGCATLVATRAARSARTVSVGLGSAWGM